MLNQGKIVRCSWEKFQSISHDPDILYVIKDKGQIWMGDKCIADTPKDIWSLGIVDTEVGKTAKITEVDEDGKPIAWEAVDGVEAFNRQGDWEQNESTRPDYIKNRTHKREEVLVPSFTLGGTARATAAGAKIQEFTVDSKTGERPTGMSVYCRVNGGPPILLPKISIPSYTIDEYSTYGYGDPSLFGSEAYEEGAPSVHDNGLDIGVGATSAEPNGWIIRVSIDSKYFDYEAIELKFGTSYETVYTPLDENYIPMTVPRATSVAVGDILRVKSIGSEGKPTEWEAISIPQSDWNQADETAADYLKNRPFGNVAYDGIVFEKVFVFGGYNLVHVPGFDVLVNIQGSRQAEIRRGGNVVNTGSASVSVSDRDGSISIKYNSTAGTIIEFKGSNGYLSEINVQSNTDITSVSEYTLHIDGLYYEEYIKLSADKVEGTLPYAEASDYIPVSSGSGKSNYTAKALSSVIPILGVSGATVGQTVKIKAVDENGKPTEWEAADMPEQIQGDWNQNDDTQPDYVKNRPFYSNRTEALNLSLEDFTFHDDGTGMGYYTYECSEPILVDFNLDNINYYISGTANSGEAFACNKTVNAYISEDGSFHDDTNYYYLTMSRNSDNNLSIELAEFGYNQFKGALTFILYKGVLKKIPVEYMPDEIYTDIINTVDSKIDLVDSKIDIKMDANNPVGAGSFSMGRKPNTTIGFNSHAEGGNTTASGHYSHAEGFVTTASGEDSHAEGGGTTASGNYSHAEGNNTTASGGLSHAEGYNTTASSAYQHAQGKYNIEDSSGTYADIIGNGTSNTARSNAATVDWSGNAWYAGDVYVGSTSGTNKDAGSKKLATEEYVDSAVSGSLPLGLTGAAAGDILRVKAVDDRGKPTEWETISTTDLVNEVLAALPAAGGN